jgi:hypothetical protein
VAEEEPTLPLDLPTAKGRRTWWQRIKAVFTEPVKLPGWAAVLLVIIQVVPDWKSRLDFWLDVAKGTGGYLATAANVIASPYFTPSMLTAGLAWLAFAGESPTGVQRHHWLRYVGWSIFLICLTVMAVTIGYGALTIYVKQQVSIADTNLQKQYAARPIYWHLTDAQRTELGIAIDQIPEDHRFKIDIQCLPDAGSRTYVEDLGKVFVEHEWKNINGNCLFSNVRPDLTGLYIGLSNALWEKMLGKSYLDWPDKNLITLAQLLQTANIEFQWSHFDDGTKEDHFYLVVGNAP